MGVYSIWAYFRESTVLVGYFREVQNFAFFKDRAVNANIKTGVLLPRPVHHMQALGGYGFLVLKCKY